MQFLINVFISVVKMLIAIGDAVLIATNTTIAILKSIVLIFYLLVSLIFRPARSFSHKHIVGLGKGKTKIHTIYKTRHHLSLKQPFLFFLRPFIVKRTKPSQPQKEIIRIKKVFVYPLPFWIKLKYFFIGIFFSLIFVFFPLLLAIFLQSLPNPRSMSLGQIPQTTKIYDRHGVLLYQVYASQNRTLISLSDIPMHLQQATIAIEDKDFYKHPGFDLTAITRSLIENFSGKSLQGGSTITQQLIKSALLNPEITIERKLKEVILAFWAERIYSKKEILELYFNYIPYGGTAWGIEAASLTYFNKQTKDLTLAESTFLAGIPKAPTIYSPFGSTPDLWKKRQKDVLNRMISLGFITRKKADQAYEEKLQFKKPQTPIHAPHFVMYIKDILVKKYGLPMVEKGGLIVKTSLDLRLQQMAERVVSEEVAINAYLNLTNGATLITSPQNGDILAMVGSRDFEDPDSGHVNLTTAYRQPGSSIKIVTYTAALHNGYTAATILDDSPVAFPGASGIYAPVNYDGRFHGRISLRMAFANSFNIPAVKTLNHIGIPTMVDFGKRMGIKSWNNPNNYGLSLTLGSAEVPMIEMATAYGTLANGGIRVDLDPILEVIDYKGNIIEEKKEIIGKRAIDEGVAFIISDILADNQARALEFGANSPLTIQGHTASVKTGTSDNKRDNWTIGYTPSYVVAVWVGNNDNSPMSQSLASGITGAAPIWNKIMTNLIQGSPDQKLVKPSNVIEKSCIGRKEYFLVGTDKNVNCAFISSPTPQPL